MTKIQPLSNQVLLRPIEDNGTGGVCIMPDSTRQENTRKGEVLAIGPGLVVADGVGVLTVPMNVKVGEIVLFNSYTAAKVYEGSEDLYLIQEISILARVKQETE